MTNLGHGATAETSQQPDGTFNVTVTIGVYSTTLQHNATEAEAMKKATNLLPIFINEAAEYMAMEF